jgi:hypothetical protein
MKPIKEKYVLVCGSRGRCGKTAGVIALAALSLLAWVCTKRKVPDQDHPKTALKNALAKPTASGDQELLANVVFVLRVPITAKLDTLRYIASLAEVRQETVPAATPVAELVRRFYVDNYALFKKVFLEYNPGYGSSHSGSTTVKLPVLPVWLPERFLRPSLRNTVHQLLAIHLGYNGEITMASVAALNPGLEGHFFEFARSPVRVPYATGYFRVQLKPELRSDAENIYQKLLGMRSKRQISRVEKAIVFQSVPYWTPASASVTSPPVASQLPTEKSAWPFRALLAEPPASGVHGRITIAVVDSGIAKDKDRRSDPDARFPYYQGPAYGPDEPPTLGHSLCGSIRFGCNLVSRGSFPFDDIETGKWRFHGTHIAGIALGRPVPLPQLTKALDDRLQLMVLKVMDANGMADSGDVAWALVIAAENGAPVINLSLSGKRAEVVEDKMRELKSQLFVVAAGNQDSGPGLSLDDLGADETVGYPARLAGALPNVITVAAHGESGALAYCSNYGRNSVHIAAPGEGILSTVGDGGYEQHTGTSEAAPLVSLTAALLLASGFPPSPPALKRRIIASADIDPRQEELEDRVRSHGKLNIRRALDYKYDVVTLRDGTVFKGSIQSPSGLSIPPRPRAKWNSIAKVVLNYSDKPNNRQYVMLLKGEEFDQWIGDLDLASFDEVIIDAVGRGVTHLKTTDIADITNREY